MPAGHVQSNMTGWHPFLPAITKHPIVLDNGLFHLVCFMQWLEGFSGWLRNRSRIKYYF